MSTLSSDVAEAALSFNTWGVVTGVFESMATVPACSGASPLLLGAGDGVCE